MKIVRELHELHTYLGSQTGASIGFVPTMGNIHTGHISLTQAAQQKNDCVIASIFVNPTQFGENEDFGSYPRTEQDDVTLLDQAGVDCVFIPDRSAIYPDDFMSMTISMPGLTDVFCGATRPGFFSGVCQVVLILCNMVKPDVLYLGAKDWQQWLVLHRLFTQLHMPVEITRVPVARADDGLALSSRNSYLSAQERSIAPLLQNTLQQTAQIIAKGDEVQHAITQAKKRLQDAGFIIDYYALVDPNRLTPIETQTQRTETSLLISAVYLGTTRLLDNVAVPYSRLHGKL